MRVLRQVHRYHHGSQFRLLPGGLSTGRFTATIKVVILLSSSSQAPLLVGLVLWTFGWAHFWSFLPILDLTGPIFICFLLHMGHHTSLWGSVEFCTLFGWVPHWSSLPTSFWIFLFYCFFWKFSCLLANLLFTLHFLSDFNWFWASLPWDFLIYIISELKAGFAILCQWGVTSVTSKECNMKIIN